MKIPQILTLIRYDSMKDFTHVVEKKQVYFIALKMI